MPNMQEIMKQIQKDLFCPVCGRRYEVSEIKVRGVFDNTIIINTVCQNGHTTVFMTSIKKKEEVSATPLTTDDVLDLNNFLEEFDGDFAKIWAN